MMHGPKTLVSVGFLSHSKQMWGWHLKMNLDLFIPRNVLFFFLHYPTTHCGSVFFPLYYHKSLIQSKFTFFKNPARRTILFTVYVLCN
jgi:hypothetical protein